MRRRPLVTLAASLAGLALLAGSVGGPSLATELLPTEEVRGAQGPGVHVVAVGDIANPGGAYAQTAALTRGLAPERVLLAGDIAYPSATISELRGLFDPSWGQFRPVWLPVPGNHEYRTARAAGYREYFDESGGLYWSRKVGSWRVIGLDSEKVASATQRRWLKATLKKHNGTPTLVMWHRPRYSRGEHSDQANTAGLFNLVRRDKDVKLLVWGHDHDYERMSVPVAGRAAPLTAFVVGTGGAEQRPGTTKDARTWSEFFDNTQYGVLDLRLDVRGFSWAFVTITGTTLDSGTQTW
jgi:3',5'-cyclic AMP phosphodiesterase CpdA